MKFLDTCRDGPDTIRSRLCPSRVIMLRDDGVPDPRDNMLASCLCEIAQMVIDAIAEAVMRPYLDPPPLRDEGKS